MLATLTLPFFKHVGPHSAQLWSCVQINREINKNKQTKCFHLHNYGFQYRNMDVDYDYDADPFADLDYDDLVKWAAEHRLEQIQKQFELEKSLGMP